MRVVTLLPAATEIVSALGGAGHLVAISHECDFPPSVLGLPRVTSTPVNGHASGGEIDAEVRGLRDSGRPVIGVDAEQLLALAPDLVITQGLCEVCAVSEGEVYRLVSRMRATRVLSLRASSLEGIWSDIEEIGAALDLKDEAEELILGLQDRLRRLRPAQAAVRPRVLCIEWLDPLFLAGHWVPQLVAAAGGEDVGAEPGSHSRRVEWVELQRLQPDHIVVMLCGFGVERSRRELDLLRDADALALLRRVPTSIIDGNSYTSRPGPRVVDGASRIQAAIEGRRRTDVERWPPVGVW